jgi:uncharacterized damage-inducible protein DinB
MIDRAYVQHMARYNRWQNRNLYGAADHLSEAERRSERGAFFGSIHNTLSHLLWGDRTQMSRFTAVERPPVGVEQSGSLYPDWPGLKDARSRFDETILAWADTVEPSWLAGEQTYFSVAIKRDVTQPNWVLVTHLFNHQTHHRGQVHCMLTQAGEHPSDTDLPFMPE